ncbi:MAG: helix-turn-helix domain containing protein [Alphaproteobacteria bacterium]|nr:helix-turn-helix domain containing protein [Alphaproteobacteria bacterium]
MVTIRDALIDAATGLLDAGGTAAVTMRDVGKRAGVSHNAPYKHFANKEALLAAVATRELARPRLAPNGKDPAITTREIMLDYAQWALSFPARFKLVFGEWKTENAALQTVADEARRRLVDAVKADQRRGYLPLGDAERLAALLLATAHGAVDQALSGHLAKDGKGRASPADLIEDIFQHLGQR